MPTTHTYHCTTEWTGSAQGPTRDTSFSRDTAVLFPNRPDLAMSAAPEFQGSADRVNPEELFVASLSSCQMLTYLYVAARRNVHVLSYVDEASGELTFKDGRMRITRVTLRPRITIGADSDPEVARKLIDQAHQDCFVANSVNCEWVAEPTIIVDQGE